MTPFDTATNGPGYGYRVVVGSTGYTTATTYTYGADTTFCCNYPRSYDDEQLYRWTPPARQRNRRGVARPIPAQPIAAVDPWMPRRRAVTPPPPWPTSIRSFRGNI